MGNEVFPHVQGHTAYREGCQRCWKEWSHIGQLYKRGIGSAHKLVVEKGQGCIQWKHIMIF